MSSKTFLLNASTRHAIFVNRFSGGQHKKIIKHLEDARKMIETELSKRNLTSAGKTRLDRALSVIDNRLRKIFEAVETEIKSEMKDFAGYELDFNKRMYDKAFNIELDVPSETQLLGAVFTNPIMLTDDALPINSTIRKYSTKKRKELIKVVKSGVIAGKTTEEVARDVKTLSRGLQSNQARALASTLIQHVSSTARDVLIAQNDDLIEGVQWVSTLDSRTTHTCKALDGKQFKKDDGPRPPIHWSCRSTTIPVVKERYRADVKGIERPAVVGKEVEQVSHNTTYNSWLKNQSKSFQEEVLGESRAKLFREGGLSMDSFVDKNYKPLTLEQLKRKEPLAFEKAGLTDSE